jgi:hypothetical protein
MPLSIHQQQKARLSPGFIFLRVVKILAALLRDLTRCSPHATAVLFGSVDEHLPAGQIGYFLRFLPFGVEEASIYVHLADQLFLLKSDHVVALLIPSFHLSRT